MTNILLIDDKKEMTTILEMLIDEYMEDNNIEEDNYNIIVKNNPFEGLYICEKSDIDILFLDIMMPGISGFEVLKEIRTKELNKQPVIIMSTALNDKETISKEKEFGANAYMVKPFKLDTVEVILDKYLNDIEFERFDIDDIFDFEIIDDENEDNKNDSFLDKIFFKSYEKLSADEFLESYPYIEDDLMNFSEELDRVRFELLSECDNEIYFKDNYNTIIEFCDESIVFLEKFYELSDMKELFEEFKRILEMVDISNLSSKEELIIGKFVEAIVLDLFDWKEHIFFKKDAVDIYYINQSFADSCKGLENIIKR
ncbi:MAG: response regulator [Campylobacterota bacterium]|nr:response regulator [Campylobacterota bacterium]